MLIFLRTIIKKIAKRIMNARWPVFHKIKRIEKYWKLKIKYPLYYKLCSISPMENNKVVFIENRFPFLTNSFERLYNALKNFDNFVLVENYLLDIEGADRQHNKFLFEVTGIERQYDKRCMEMIKEVATARCVFVNDSSNIVGCIPFRKGTDIVQVWHACGAFKKWGFSNAKGKYGASLKDLLRYPLYANYTLVTVSSNDVAWAYAEAFNIPIESGKIKATGVSRTDVFFDENFRKNAFDKIYHVVPESREKKVILYAPTFRGNAGYAQSPDNMPLGLLKKKLQDEYVLLVKHHPLVKNRPKIKDGCENFTFDVTDELSIEELICASDICITDYSSIIFEYSLLEKPIIIYAFDIDEYADWRGFYYNFEEFAPGPIIKNDKDLVKCLLNLEKYDIGKVKEFRKKYMSACDGGSTERIIFEIFGKEVM